VRNDRARHDISGYLCGFAMLETRIITAAEAIREALDLALA
jgi:hypothetical protein